jgi:Fumarylacetoacetate (FAA) hydrolase family
VLPIERPGKIVCVGLNYRDHAEEQGVELPEEPLLFAKWPNALIGPGDPIVIPPLVTKCDYEAELGVVIGARVRGVSSENALEAVRGYVCANDVSARDLQFKDGQWTRGKSVDTFCPVGPLVPAGEIPDPHDLRIRAIVAFATYSTYWDQLDLAEFHVPIVEAIRVGDPTRARAEARKHVGRTERVVRRRTRSARRRAAQ